MQPPKNTNPESLIFCVGLAYTPKQDHYLIVFIVAGSLLALGGFLGLPLKKLSDMEKRKRKGIAKAEEKEEGIRNEELYIDDIPVAKDANTADVIDEVQEDEDRNLA